LVRNLIQQSIGKEKAMRNFISTGALAVMLGGSLLLGGCATQEAVEHAQATADSAKSDAAAAMSAAQAASASAQAANNKIDQFTDEERAESAKERNSHSMTGDKHHWRHHHHGRHHHHHHHMQKKTGSE
jgi:sRNA-binding protein